MKIVKRMKNEIKIVKLRAGRRILTFDRALGKPFF